MSSHYKWYPTEAEVVVPWNARYSFPSQANKAVKMTPRIPPKNGGTFTPGQVIRLEFPAQGYVNPTATTMSFDATLLYGNIAAADKTTTVRFQNNIQSCFSRVRLMYGATPLEDIIGYNQIVRSLTEWTGNSPDGVLTQSSVHEGIGSYSNGMSGHITTAAATTSGVNDSSALPGLVNTRQAYIQGVSTVLNATQATYPAAPLGMGFGVVPAGTLTVSPVIASPDADIILSTNPVRRYQVQFALGLFTQNKLIPTKFMASQLAIEITLANAAECIFAPISANVPSYQITNVNLIPEILEFDASYDEMFLRGLMDRGVPIKFSTWNNYKFGVTGSTANLQIQERSRSVKAIFAMQRRDPVNFTTDSGASFFNTATNVAEGTISLQEYQYRIGGRYFPAAPVQNATTVGGNVSNGGAESWIELQKALNFMGDNRLAVPCNVLKWAINATTFTGSSFATSVEYPEYDYSRTVVGWRNGSCYANIVSSATNSFSGTMGSSCFVMAIDLETSSGSEISGLNAEEQSDISLIARWSANQNTSFVFDVYTYIDSMIVLRENNVIELIQ